MTPVIDPENKALTRSRLSHVDQNYVRADTIAAANAALIAAQSRIELAQMWGGGLLASVDDLRFVVPAAGYGPLEAVASNKVNLKRIATHWPDMLRVAGSLITNQVRASGPLPV